MPAGRPCGICKDPKKLKLANALIADGLSDQKIADQLGMADRAGRMVISRHRNRHVEALARAIAAVANKGRDVREQRDKTVAAANRGELDPAALLSLSSLTGDLRKALDRIERASDAAEQAGQIGVLSGLLQQLHRNIETRSRIAGVGGFAPASTKVGVAIGGAGHMPFEPFVLSMTFGGERQTLVMATQGQPEFEVRDARTGRRFEGRNNSGAIVTKAGEPPPEIMVTPKGWEPSADYRSPIEHDELDEELIDHIARQAGDNQPSGADDDEGDGG